MGPPPSSTPPKIEEGLVGLSDEEDAAEQALRFRVYTRKQSAPEEASRLQHVVDKPIVWGPDIMPVSSVASIDDAAREKVERTDIKGARDCFKLKGIFSPAECRRLVNAAEAHGFEYWGKETSNSSSSGNSSSHCSVSAKANNSYRSAYTLEVEHPDLADLIWQRVKEVVVKELTFTEDDERFERDIGGTWEACGVNSTLLFARYIGGENFGPHTDGCTIRDFNSRSLWPMVIYLNTPQQGGETSVISGEQKDVALQKDEAGRFTANPRLVVYNCKPREGHALLFYHTQMHEGRPVAEKSVKYIIRTDIMYRRTEPLFTSPAERKAFALWQKAQLLAERGETDAAAVLFRTMTRVSPELAHFYGL